MSTVCRMIRRWLAPVLLVLALCVAAGAGDWEEEKRIPAEQLVPTLQEGLQLLAQAEPAELTPLAEEQGLELVQGRVTVVAETTERFHSADVAGIGGRVIYETDGLVEVSIAPGRLVPLAKLPGVAFVRRPYEARALSLSEGVPLTGTPAWHTEGITGQGVRVAVIDLGFSGLTRARNLGRLRHVVRTVDYTGVGLETVTVHGTACAEIVQDMAPEAELILMKIATEVQLARAVEDAIAWGATVISHSVGWFNTNFYDGTGVIGDIVRDATARGVLWVNAAGNHARAHWGGSWTDTTGSGFLEFAPGVEMNQFELSRGETVSIWLTWDGWPTTDQDYDLYLVDALRGAVLARSTGHQDGRQPPTEQITFTSPMGGKYAVVVHNYDAPATPDLKVFLTSNAVLEHPVTQRSLLAPANAADSFSVAAIHWRNWSTGPQEIFSSQGPANTSRLSPLPRAKPDIAGPNRVSTTSYGPEAFVGTSAAAPHVAGAAALLLSANPHWSVSALRGYLTDNAVDMGPPGRDTLYGSGRLDLGDPVEPTPPVPEPDPSYTYGGTPGWYMVSVPTTGEADELFGVTLFRWNPGTGEYTTPAALQPGHGYWARLPGGKEVTATGTVPASDVTVELNVSGWHQISAPWELEKSALRLTRAGETRSWSSAVAVGWIRDTIYAYKTPGLDYTTPTTLEPWYGYWIRANVPGLTVKLSYDARMRTELGLGSSP